MESSFLSGFDIKECPDVDFATFFVQFLHWQIPKAQKNTVKLSVFIALLGSVRLKAVCKMLAKSTPDSLRLKSREMSCSIWVSTESQYAFQL